MARWFPPRGGRDFDPAFFQKEKERFLGKLKEGELNSALIPLESEAFETRLAYLETLMQVRAGEGRSLGKVFQSLPPYRQKRLYRSVQRILGPKARFNARTLEYEFQDLYADVLRWHYPHLFDGISPPAVEETLKNVLRARLGSREVAGTLQEMGLLKKDLAGFRRILDDRLKGQAFPIALNAQINAGILKGAGAGLNPPMLLLPDLKLHRWIDLPESLLEKASREGLDAAWNAGLKDELVKRYGGLVKADILYHHLQSAWSEVCYWSYLGYLGRVAWDFPEEYRKMKEGERLDHHFDQMPDAVPKDQEKAVLTEDEKKRRWEDWKTAHPSAAKDSTGEEYRYMHQIIFGK